MTTTHKEWQAALRWEMQQRGLAPPTRRAYSRWVGRFLRYLGAAGPRNAGLSQVKGYLAWESKKGQSPGSLRLAISAIRFFQIRVVGAEAPTPDALGFRKGAPRKLPQLSDEQIYAAITRLGPAHALIARLVFRCGLRAEEGCRLLIGDVQEYQGLIRVDGSGSSKGKVRTVDLPMDLLGLVTSQKALARRVWIRDHQESWGNPRDIEAPPQAWMFPASNRRWKSEDGLSLEGRRHRSPTTFQRELRNAFLQAGLPVSRPCSVLRAAFRDRGLRRGGCPRLIAEALGVGSLAQTIPGYSQIPAD